MCRRCCSSGGRRRTAGRGASSGPCGTCKTGAGRSRETQLASPRTESDLDVEPGASQVERSDSRRTTKTLGTTSSTEQQCAPRGPLRLQGGPPCSRNGADVRSLSRKEVTRRGNIVTGVFEIYRASKGEYRFRYRAGSGEIVATSAAYPTRAEAKRAMAAVLRAADGSDRADRPSRRHRWRRPSLG